MRVKDVIPTWVYDLLAVYGNAVIPPEVIDYYGVAYTAELLTDIMGKPVTIKSNKYQDFTRYGKPVTKIGYSAWLKK